MSPQVAIVDQNILKVGLSGQETNLHRLIGLLISRAVAIGRRGA